MVYVCRWNNSLFHNRIHVCTYKLLRYPNITEQCCFFFLLISLLMHKHLSSNGRNNNNIKFYAIIILSVLHILDHFCLVFSLLWICSRCAALLKWLIHQEDNNEMTHALSTFRYCAEWHSCVIARLVLMARSSCANAYVQHTIWFTIS